jgi:hypothetical protein
MEPGSPEMGEYRSKAAARHWSDRSWWNPRRWAAVPIVIAMVGAILTLTGVLVQILDGGISAWGAVALVGVLLTVGSIAWAQSDLNYLKNRERRERNRSL